ncbi:MAG: hypothetical protein KC713_09760, partial [Candidatus Omnitrophica bacterium]|nr:hypothetical protein [Candidatus Omnitrophota bacterium]
MRLKPIHNIRYSKMTPIENHDLRLLSESILTNVKRLDLDLTNRSIVTECATGHYVCTPLIALLSNAQSVTAFGQNTQYGTFEQAKQLLMDTAEFMGLPLERLTVTNERTLLKQRLHRADILTNTGHLRPIDKEMIACLPEKAVIPLMYESWEYREGDLDLREAQKKGIRVIGTNECLPEVNIFDFLGELVIKSLLNVGIDILGHTIILVCDNPFKTFIKRVLMNHGCRVLFSEDEIGSAKVNGIIFAHTPIVCGGKGQICFKNLPEKVEYCCQLWGDVRREKFDTLWIPQIEPRPGHMGLLLSELGPEPIVRLQTASLKAAQEFLNGHVDSPFI